MAKIVPIFDRVLLLSSDNPDLPNDVINIKTFEKVAFRRQNPVLVWNCVVNFKGFLWSFGGRHSEKSIYKLDNSCHFEENRLKLPRGYISHECTVHDEFLYLCPDWDLSTTCTKIDYVSGKLLIDDEFPLDTERFLATMVSTKRGLMAIGGKNMATTAVMRFINELSKVFSILNFKHALVGL